MKSKVLRQLAQTLGTSGLSMLFGIATSIVVTRSLGPEGKGAYAVAVYAISILIGISQFGLPEVMLLQMRVDRRRPSELAANSLVAVIVGTALAAMLLWASYPLLANSFYKGIGQPLIWLAFLMLPGSLAFLFFSRLIHLDGRLGTYNCLTITSKGLSFAAILLCFRVHPGEPGAAILGLAIAQGLVAVPAILLVRSYVAPRAWRIDLALLGESFRGGFKVQWGMLAHLIDQYLGIFILNYFLGLQSVGWFSTALGLATFVLLLSEAIRTVLQAWMPNAAHIPDQVAERTAEFARHTIILLCLASFLLFIFGLPLIRLMYGIEFEPSYAPMVILLVGVIARGVGQIVASHLSFAGHLGLASAATVLGLAGHICMAWIFVPILGMWGAALASTAGYLVHTLFLIYWFLQKNGLPLGVLLPRASDGRLYISVIRSGILQITEHRHTQIT